MYRLQLYHSGNAINRVIIQNNDLPPDTYELVNFHVVLMTIINNFY